MIRKRTQSFLTLIFKGLWTSRLGISGVVITTVAACLVITSFLLQGQGLMSGAYQGLITYMLLPAVFMAGLVMIPFGAWLSRRKAARTGAYAESRLVIDFGNPRHRRFWGFILIMSIFNFGIISMLSYQGYHYTESVGFCGTLCHTVMHPEYQAYQRSPHARVACVECHIGSGASWFAKSKISGLRQVWAVTVGNYSKPIPVPIAELRPSRDTCEECHWPEVFHGDRLKVVRKIPEDGPADDPSVTALLLHVGGRDSKTGSYTGIHWHVSDNNKVEFRYSDEKRMQIKEVRVTRPDGKQVTYTKDDGPAVPKDKPWRVMECIDCHNRPSHIYDPPDVAIDREILMGLIDPSLPGIKKAVKQAVTATYESQEVAQEGIRTAMLAFYRTNHPKVLAEKKEAILASAKDAFDHVYARNVFPSMNIAWDTYPSHLGHHDDLGCFRCHDEEHEAPDGSTIEQDCDTCHAFIVEDTKASELDDSTKTLLQEAN